MPTLRIDMFGTVLSAALFMFSAAAAAPTGAEILNHGVWGVIADKYPLIFVSLASAAGVLWFVRDMQQRNDVRQVERDKFLFDKFRELQQQYESDAKAMQGVFTAEMKLTNERANASLDRSSLAIENIIRLEQQVLSEKSEYVQTMRQVRDYLRDLNTAAQTKH